MKLALFHFEILEMPTDLLCKACLIHDKKKNDSVRELPTRQDDLIYDNNIDWNNYPGQCISSAPPDSDCGDIGSENFKVLSSDPRKFDGEVDGIGCES